MGNGGDFISLGSLKDSLLKDKDLKREYAIGGPMAELIKVCIHYRVDKCLSDGDMAKMFGMVEKDYHNLERGAYDVSLTKASEMLYDMGHTMVILDTYAFGKRVDKINKGGK